MRIDRLGAIRQHLYANGPASIADLCSAVGASLATVRRDLAALERQGLVERVHGGARLAEGSGVELAFDRRESTNLAAKRAIAAAACALIEPGSAVFLDAGTTVLQLARRLRLDPIPLTAITNGLPVAQELFGVPGIRLVVIGGELRAEHASIVGPHAEAQLDRMHFDQLFMGAGAIGEDLALTTGDLAEASLNARMLARARQRILLADSSKFGHSTTHVVGSVAGITHIVTDAALPGRWRQPIEAAGAALVTADFLRAEA